MLQCFKGLAKWRKKYWAAAVRQRLHLKGSDVLVCECVSVELVGDVTQCPPTCSKHGPGPHMTSQHMCVWDFTTLLLLTTHSVILQSQSWLNCWQYSVGLKMHNKLDHRVGGFFSLKAPFDENYCKTLNVLRICVSIQSVNCPRNETNSPFLVLKIDHLWCHKGQRNPPSQLCSFRCASWDRLLFVLQKCRRPTKHQF